MGEEGLWSIKKKTSRGWDYGLEHRKKKHKFYQKYDTLEDLLEGIERREYEHLYGELEPEAESHISHETLDKLWDEFSREAKKDFIRWLLFYFVENPHMAWPIYGVDPSLGLVLREVKKEEFSDYQRAVEEILVLR